MRRPNDIQDAFRPRRLLATCATASVALLLAGCGNDPDEGYTAEGNEDVPYAANQDTRDYTPAEVEDQVMAARQAEGSEGFFADEEKAEEIGYLDEEERVAADTGARQTSEAQEATGPQDDPWTFSDQNQQALASQQAQASRQPQSQPQQTTEQPTTAEQAAQSQADQSPASAEQGQQYSQTQPQTQETQQGQQNLSAQAQQGQQSQQGQQPQATGMAPEGASVQESARIALDEEQLDVQKRQVPAGGIVLRKNVVTDEASETVDLRREEIEITRLSPEEARQRQQQGNQQGEFSQSFSEEEVFIPLMSEEAVTETDVETRQIVRADTEAETQQRDVSATVRSEELEIERVGQAQSQQPQQASANQQTQDDQQSAQNQQVPQNQQAVQGTQNSESVQQQASTQQDRNSEQLKSVVMDRLRSETDLSQEELDQIEIEVEQNAVTVSGSAPSEEIAAQIEEEIRRIEGVASVDSNL